MPNYQNLQEEVREFRLVLHKIRQFCSAEIEAAHAKETETETGAGVEPAKDDVVGLVIGAGRWADSVRLTRAKCQWLTLDEPSFTTHLRNVGGQPKHKKNILGLSHGLIQTLVR